MIYTRGQSDSGTLTSEISIDVTVFCAATNSVCPTASHVYLRIEINCINCNESQQFETSVQNYLQGFLGI